MPLNEVFIPPALAKHRLPSLLWGCIFFVLINIVVVFIMKYDKNVSNRLPYDPTYEDIHEMLIKIQNEKKPVIVIIGGSVVWGVGHKENETIAMNLQKRLGGQVKVFNLGMIGARPLDEFLLAWLVRDTADLIITDYNYEFGGEISQERLWREKDTYLRHPQLLSIFAEEFFKDIPQIPTCFQQWKITIPQNMGVLERGAMNAFQATIPLIHYKHKINRIIFGQHPLLIVEKFHRNAGKILQGNVRVQDLLQPAAQDKTTPWSPPGTIEEQELSEKYLKKTFASDTLITCQVKAFSEYMQEKKLHLFAYITPMNPAMFFNLHSSPVHKQNVNLFEKLFSPIPLINLDTGTFPSTAFTDATHLTATGALLVADALLPNILHYMSPR